MGGLDVRLESFAMRVRSSLSAFKVGKPALFYVAAASVCVAFAAALFMAAYAVGADIGRSIYYLTHFN